MTHDETKKAIRKLNLCEGDCVVVTSSAPIGQEQRVRIGESIKALLESLSIKAPVLVLDRGLDIKILRTSELDRSNDSE